MAEFEELRLQVTLVDQASAGLEQLNAQIKQLSSGSNKAQFDELARRSKEVSEHLKRVEQQQKATAGAAEGTAAALRLVWRAIEVGAAIVLTKFALTKTLAERVQEFGDLSSATGFSVAQVNEMMREMELAGISKERAQENIRGISKAMADILRPDSEIVKRIFGTGDMSPEQRAAMNASIAEAKQLALQGKGAAFGNWLTRTIQENVSEGIANGLTQQQAASAAERWAEILFVPGLRHFRREFKEVSQEQIDFWARQEAGARKFNEHLAGIWQNIKDITTRGFAADISDPNILRWLESIADWTKTIGDRIAGWQKDPKGNTLQLALRALMPFLIWFQGGGLSLLDYLTGRIPGGTEKRPDRPLRFFQSGDDAEQRDKYLAENTAEFKRLNDFLLLGFGGDILKTRLGITGDGAGADGSGDGGGAGRSDVGPGTGPGAGGTPATGGTQQETAGAAGTGGPSAAGLRGSPAQNAQRIYDTLRGLGHTHEQASAALAHARAESSFNPNTTGDRGTAFGFFQMRGERWANAQRKAREWGLDPRSPEAAARFLDWELRNDPRNAGRGVGQRYFGAQSTREAVTALNAYERFRGYQQGQPHRYRYGEQFERSMRPSGDADATPGPQSSVSPEPDRSVLDGSLGGRSVQSSGRLNVDVDAPRNTRVTAQGRGLLRRVTLNRRMPLEPAMQE